MTELPQEPPCQCPGPGFCDRYQIQQTDYTFRLCSNTCTEQFPCDEAASQRMRQSWARKRDRKKGTRHAQRTRSPVAVATTSSVSAQPARKSLCVHLGKPTGELRECKTCGAKMQKHRVYGCEKHGECTIGKRFDQLACCAGCDDYQPREEAG